MNQIRGFLLLGLLWIACGCGETTPSLKSRAEKGDVEAQFELGEFYCNQPATKENVTEYLFWMRKAAERGHPRAQYAVGSSYKFGWQDGVLEKNYAEAAKWFCLAASNRVPEARYGLASMYERGEGFTIDLEKAAELYRESAEQGYAAAQYQFGWMCQRGAGVLQSWEEARHWYYKAAIQGHESAQREYWQHYYPWSESWKSEKPVKESYPKNADEAVKLWRKLATTGDVQSQCNLGEIFWTGDGVAKDLTESAKWCMLAAEQNDVVAQLRLGEMFEKGQGLPKDEIEAYKWYNLAAAKQIIGALAGLANLEKRLTPEQIAEGKKRSTEFLFKRPK